MTFAFGILNLKNLVLIWNLRFVIWNFNFMYIKVKVTANARKESFEKISSDHFEASVKEKAERNMANRRVLELVANFFEVPAGKVKLVSGHHSPGKILNVETDE
jgi:uncharacterized protein YggU (UPF0235/DUF167 family)